jgi:hypothetical protein
MKVSIASARANALCRCTMGVEQAKRAARGPLVMTIHPARCLVARAWIYIRQSGSGPWLLFLSQAALIAGATPGSRPLKSSELPPQSLRAAAPGRLVGVATRSVMAIRAGSEPLSAARDVVTIHPHEHAPASVFTYAAVADARHHSPAPSLQLVTTWKTGPRAVTLPWPEKDGPRW